jgi:hypothetical protein
MSLDYSQSITRDGLVIQSQVVNGTTKLGQYIFSRSFNFKVLHAQVRINVAATTSLGSFQVQVSDATGVAGFTSMVTIPILSTNGVGSMLEGRPTTNGEVTANGLRCARIAHVSTATDATLNYDYEVTFTSVHE